MPHNSDFAAIGGTNSLPAKVDSEKADSSSAENTPVKNQNDPSIDSSSPITPS